jgi:hypothetical protein
VLVFEITLIIKKILFFTLLRLFSKPLLQSNYLIVSSSCLSRAASHPAADVDPLIGGANALPLG